MHGPQERVMRTLIAAAASAAMLAWSGVSQAAQIASPMIFGNVEQDRAECVVLNGGTSPIAVTVKIVDEAGATKATSTCGGPLAAGEFCSLNIALGFVGPFGCTATAASVTNLRGALALEEQVLDSFGLFQLHVVRTAPLSR